MTVAYRIIRALIRIAMLLLTRTVICGRERLPPTGSGIVVCNHIHAVDPAILVGALPRPLALMSKVENDRGLLRPFLRLAGAFTIRRGAPDRSALDMAARALKNGELLCLFPEGTRSRDGVLGQGYGGAALLALKTDTLIIPVAITGTSRIFLSSFPWLGFPRVTVTIGKPFAPPPANGSAHRADREQLTGVIMAHIAELLPPEMRGAHVAPEVGR